MTDSVSKRIFLASSAVVVLVIAVTAIVSHTVNSSQASGPAHRAGGQLILEAPRALDKPTAARAKALSNVDPETQQRGLRAEHRWVLLSRPLEQHLPYRDREIGVDMVDLTRGGKLVLLLTYIHSRSSARLHLQRLLARYHDPGRAYVIRYQPVFR